jgi:hypothetical protein
MKSGWVFTAQFIKNGQPDVFTAKVMSEQDVQLPEAFMAMLQQFAREKGASASFTALSVMRTVVPLILTPKDHLDHLKGGGA